MAVALHNAFAVSTAPANNADCSPLAPATDTKEKRSKVCCGFAPSSSSACVGGDRYLGKV